MELTEKAKEDFEKWLYSKHKMYLKDLKDVDLDGNIFQNTLIIDFFGSVGIYISIINGKNLSRIYIESDLKNYHQIEENEFKSRQKAKTEAIKKANEIYNQNH